MAEEADVTKEDASLELQPSDAIPSIIDPSISSPETDMRRRFSKQGRKSFEPPKDENGQFFCDYPQPLSDDCASLRFNRKCEYHKHMDKHLRPHVCQVSDCKQPGFTYPGGLRRHQAEVHGMHGGPKEVLYCPYPYCKRNSGEPFTRRENMQEHISRLHTKGKENKDPAAEAPTGGDTTLDEASGLTESGDTNGVVDSASTPDPSAPTSMLSDTVPSETLKIAASASTNAASVMDPNIDPSFTQEPIDPTAPLAAANNETFTPKSAQRRSKKRKIDQTTIKESEYTPVVASTAPIAHMGTHDSAGSQLHAIPSLAMLQEQLKQQKMQIDFLQDATDALREQNASLREENTSLKEALTAVAVT